MADAIPDLYTLAGAAEASGRDPAVITRAVQAGTLPHVTTACGRAKLIRKRDLDRWAKSAGTHTRRPKTVDVIK